MLTWVVWVRSDLLSTIQSSIGAGQDASQTLFNLMDWAENRQVRSFDPENPLHGKALSMSLHASFPFDFLHNLIETGIDIKSSGCDGRLCR